MPYLTLYDDNKLLINSNNRLKLSDSLTDPCCCDDLCAYVVCISVIDEDDQYTTSLRNRDWSTFRAAWPDRKFFLLQPNINNRQQVGLPAGWDGTGPIQVNRDEGNSSMASDWYTLCNIDENLSKGGKISLFIDNSGSMTISTVRASYNLFLLKLATRTKNNEPDPVTTDNRRLIVTFGGLSERWIGPHISIPDCPPT